MSHEMQRNRKLRRDVIRFGVSRKRKLRIEKRKKILVKIFPQSFLSALTVDEGKSFMERENGIKFSSPSSKFL